jgi:hypothetical protein
MMRSLAAALALAAASCAAWAAPARPPLDLRGYADDAGAITVQRSGSTIDPYFTLQALLLAHEHGLGVQPHAAKWAAWLMPRQKPDGTFDRFCRTSAGWGPCKTADADDSLLALWLKFLETMPGELARDPAWQKSHGAARAPLARLVDPRWHVYLVSPVYQHALFMDNIEVWSYAPARAAAQAAAYPDMAESMHRVFWDEAGRRFLVSTQPEQKTAEPAFYPDAVAQIFPLLHDYPRVPGGAAAWYRAWMKQHRTEWLAQVRTDFAWGVVALVAHKQGDARSAACWLRATRDFRHSMHWTLTDEVVAQVLAANKVAAAPESADCR